MFGLCAAFDTVNHSILLRRLEISFGIRGAALKWFSSYLTGRSQQVSVLNVMAMSVFLDYGVLQGSVLGPVLLLLYTSDLVELVRSFGLLTHAYCIEIVGRWMSSNRLRLNQSKTEFIWLGSTHRLARCTFDPITIGGEIIQPSQTVRDLGA